MKCMECGNGVMKRVKTTDVITIDGGVELKIKSVPVLKCSKCGDVLMDSVAIARTKHLALEALKRWFGLKHQIDPLTRKYMARILRAACEKAFPGDLKKHLVFHDLRHCYAIMLRERGLTTEDVADLIGDSLLVAKEHYSGFGESPAIMDLRRRAIQRRPKKAA